MVSVWLSRISLVFMCLSLAYGVKVIWAQSEDGEDYEEDYDSDEEDEDDEEDYEEDGEDEDDIEDDGPPDLLTLDVTDGLAVEEVVEEELPYEFSLLGQDDPFVPKILLIHFEGGEEFSAETIEEALTDTPILQEHPLNDFRLTGIWTTEGVTKGLILTPGANPQGVVVEVGDLIGEKNGTIIEIDKQGLVVREVHIDGDHQRKVNDRRLDLFNVDQAQALGTN